MPPIFVIMTVIPYFWIGLVLILIFGVKLKLLPYFFSYNFSLTPGFNAAFIGNVAEHAILPAFTLLITTIGIWILTMRNTMITTLAEDYVRMARAKGLPNHRIMLDYAARNAILPNLTGFAMSLGFVVGGAILIEEVFNYQGVGYLLLQAVNNERLPADAGAVPADHRGRAAGDPALGPGDGHTRPADQGGGLAMATLQTPPGASETGTGTRPSGRLPRRRGCRWPAAARSRAPARCGGWPAPSPPTARPRSARCCCCCSPSWRCFPGSSRTTTRRPRSTRAA